MVDYNTKIPIIPSRYDPRYNISFTSNKTGFPLKRLRVMTRGGTTGMTAGGAKCGEPIPFTSNKTGFPLKSLPLAGCKQGTTGMTAGECGNDDGGVRE